MVVSNHVGMDQVHEATRRVRSIMGANSNIAKRDVARRVAAEVTICVYVSRNKVFASYITPVSPGSKGYDEGATFEKRVPLWV